MAVPPRMLGTVRTSPSPPPSMRTLALRRAGPGAGGDVDDPRHGARAVERRPGAAQHLDPFRIDRGQALEERSGVALRARGVAEAHAVDQQRGVVAAQAAGLDGRVAPRPAERLHPDSGNRADRLGDRQLVPERDLLGVDDVDRLGDLLNRQGRRRRRHHHLGRDAGDCQREIENLQVAGDGHHGRAGQRTSPEARPSRTYSPLGMSPKTYCPSGPETPSRS